MARKIYDRTIYHSRLNQLERKVYDRVNNVLPYEPEPPVGVSYEVTNVAVTTPGSNYKVTDVLSIPGSGQDTASTVTVTAVNETKAITNVTIENAGESTTDPTNTNASVTGGAGTGATLNVVGEALTNYQATNLTVSNGGTGYAQEDVITISADVTDITAKVTAVSGGVVTTLEITNPGESTTDLTNTGVSTEGGTGTGLTVDLTTTLIPGYKIASATVAEGGSGYEQNDTLTLDLDKVDATFIVQSIDTNGSISTVEITTPGSYSENLSGEIEPTGGTGTGASLNVTMSIKE